MSLLSTTNSSLASVSYLIESTANDLNNTENLLNTTNGSLYATTAVAALALAEVNLLAGILGFKIAADSAGNLASQGQMTSDNGTFNESVSSTDMYCTNLHCYNNAIIDTDLQVNGNIHGGLGTVFFFAVK